MKKLTPLIILIFFLITYHLLPIPFVFALSENESTEGAQSVREAIRKRVEEKLAKLSKSPKAVVGELKEVTDTTLNITTKNGEILAATNEDTKYFRVTKGKQVAVKFEDLVLNDFIVAMGYKNGNNVLDAKRVISYNVSPLVEKKAIYGVVRTNMNGSLGVQTSSGLVTVQTDDDTKVTKKADGSKLEEVDVEEINLGDKILATATPNSKKPGTVIADKVRVLVSAEPKAEDVSPTPTKKATPTPTKKLTPTPTL